MQYNRPLKIAVGSSRFSTNWQNTDTTWVELTERLKTPIRTSESILDYLGLNKAQQANLKDVGGFVGGTLQGTHRRSGCVTARDIVTLDLDNIPRDKTEDVVKKVEGLGCAYCVYSTRKHTAYAPRLRVLIPLDRPATADEYGPIARKMAELVGIDMADKTTFEATRLMYWPSCSRDSEYVYQVGDKPFCSADGILAMYADWRDVATWPRVPGEDTEQKRLVAKQEDPTGKAGIVGAFCRTYNVLEAMDAFLHGMYEPTVHADRYTYTGGTTAGGAVIYDDGKYMYSHHATDPCGGKLVNAWDLVRIHMFGDKDDLAKEGTPPAKLPSYLAMQEMAGNDKKVKSTLARERFEEARDKFAEIIPMPEQARTEGNTALKQETEPADDSWMQALDTDRTGATRKTIDNAVTIMENDQYLAGKLAIDDFAGRKIVRGAVPWDSRAEQRQWTDADDSGLRHYIEVRYGLTGKDKIDDALTIVGNRHKINEVRDYLEAQHWDGTHRLDTLFVDYLGAEDTEYTRAVTRKALCAAVARAVEEKVKFEYMIVLTGAQGLGKSTIISKLGMQWFSDSLTTFEGKDAAELIQGTWINEVAELSALTRTETEIVKQFLGKSADIYRAAYGRNTERHPRRCIFIGTSNGYEYLKDSTGNRRFWPVDVGRSRPKKSVFDDLSDAEVGQIWAEAYAYYTAGERLYLDQELEAVARRQQEAHREGSVKEGIIEEYLNKKIPDNWYSLDRSTRRMWLNGDLAADGRNIVERDKVCAAEIWEDCFGMDKARMRKSDSIEINNIMSRMPGWTRNRDKRRYGEYGAQRGFEKEWVYPNSN